MARDVQMDGISDRRMAALEAPSDGSGACTRRIKALNALGARIAVPYGRACLK
jgi:hypothetical protein